MRRNPWDASSKLPVSTAIRSANLSRQGFRRSHSPWSRSALALGCQVFLTQHKKIARTISDHVEVIKFHAWANTRLGCRIHCWKGLKLKECSRFLHFLNRTEDLGDDMHFLIFAVEPITCSCEIIRLYGSWSSYIEELSISLMPMPENKSITHSN